MNKVSKYRKKPVVINAIQFNGSNYDDILNFMGSYESDKDMPSQMGDVLYIHTLEGQMTASKGDYIIKGVNGEFYPCKPDIFDKTYEPINPTTDLYTFGSAVELLKEGKKVARKGWNGKGMFLFLAKTNDITTKADLSCVPTLEGEGLILPAIYMKTADNKFVAWLASQTDVLAEDWVLLD